MPGFAKAVKPAFEACPISISPTAVAEIPLMFSESAAAFIVALPTALIVFPVFVKPVPAITCPAPEN